MFDKRPKSPAKMFFMFIILAPLFIGLYAYAVQLLWNWLLPDIVGASEITFWQAMGIIALSKLLFGFGGMGKKRNHCHYKSNSWKSKMKARFDSMSDEQRAECYQGWEKMKAGWKQSSEKDQSESD